MSLRCNIDPVLVLHPHFTFCKRGGESGQILQLYFQNSNDFAAVFFFLHVHSRWTYIMNMSKIWVGHRQLTWKWKGVVLAWSECEWPIWKQKLCFLLFQKCRAANISILQSGRFSSPIRKISYITYNLMDKKFPESGRLSICVPGLVYFPWKSGSLLQNQEELAAPEMATDHEKVAPGSLEIIRTRSKLFRLLAPGPYRLD